MEDKQEYRQGQKISSQPGQTKNHLILEDATELCEIANEVAGLLVTKGLTHSDAVFVLRRAEQAIGNYKLTISVSITRQR